jgi:hypothetical protein
VGKPDPDISTGYPPLVPPEAGFKLLRVRGKFMGSTSSEGSATPSPSTLTSTVAYPAGTAGSPFSFVGILQVNISKLPPSSTIHSFPSIITVTCSMEGLDSSPSSSAAMGKAKLMVTDDPSLSCLVI